MAFPIRLRTQAVLVEAIDQGFTHSEIGTLFLRAEATPWEARADATKQQRVRWLLKNLESDGSAQAEEVVLELLRLVLVKGSPRSDYEQPSVWQPGLVEAISADGLEWDEDGCCLVPTVPRVSVPAVESWIEGGLEARGWKVAAGHYRQALEAFGQGRWASANGQMRSAIEAVLPAVALAVTGKSATNATAALQFLQDHGALAKGEFGFAKGLWEMSQTNGAHPGLSDDEESRFRVLTATAYLRYLLTRVP